MLSLSFRDQNDSVIEKAKAKAKAAKSRKSPPHPRTKAGPSRSGGELISETTTAPNTCLPAFSNTDFVFQPSEDLPGVSVTSWDIKSSPERNSITPAIYPSSEELGINYFFANFVAPQYGLPRGNFQYLHQVAKEDGLDPCLKTSMIATGLASLANISKSARLMSKSRREYTSALQSINAALAPPTDAIKDSTLVSIVILAIFEATAGAFQLSLKAWTEHINGAAALIKLRGRSQLRSRVGIGIFLQATSHLLISCVQRELPMPVEISELRHEAFGKLMIPF